VPPPPPPVQPLAVPAFDPAPAASGVARTASVSASFGANLAGSSVNANSVALLSPGGAAIPAALAVTGSQLRITPTNALPGDTTYTVRIATTVADVNGAVLPAPATASFTTAAQAWSEVPAVVHTLPKVTAYAYPNTVVDRAGNVTATFQNASGSNTLYAARLDNATGKWGTPVVAGQVTDRNLSPGPLVALPDGDLVQYWIDHSRGDSALDPPQVRQARFDHTSATWTASTTLTLLPAGLVPDGFQVIVDDAGNQTALMINTAGSGQPVLHAARLDRQSGKWSTAERVDRMAATGQLRAYMAAADRAGNVTALWQEVVADVRNLKSARYEVATGRWGTPVLVAENVSEGGEGGTLAVAPGGTVFAIWNDRAGSGRSAPVRVARFDPATRTWTSGRRVDTAGYPTGYPQIAVDAAGYVMASWVQQPYRLEVVATRFDPASLEWPAPKTLSTGGYVEMNLPKLAVDVAGNAVVVFSEDDSMKAVRYRSSDDAWGSATLIGKHAEGWEKSKLVPALVMDGSGVATAVWAMTNRIAWATVSIYDNEIVANRFR
jgi:hypothetical protein